jgi:septum formation topological specificity factor MinE
MTSLSLIEKEAERLVGRLPESRRLALQTTLVELCETHWHALRGSQPESPLQQMLWRVTPPLADLLMDLYAAGDVRLAGILPGGHLTRGMALLVLAEIERGNEMGVHIAHEPMMAFESATPPAALLERITALLHGTLEPPRLHAHDKHHGAMWKALAVIAAYTRRLDLPAVLEVIRLLCVSTDQAGVGSDVALERMREEVAEVGVRFLNIEDDHIYFEQHGHAHKPIRVRRLGEILLEIRQMWLG